MGGRLRDLPTAATLAGAAPAMLQSCDLAGARAIALVRAAREVARGRVDLHGAEPERGWRRLRAIPGIGAWTVEMLALRGQGRYDQLPAGDLGLLKLVGRMLSGGDPRARASEAEVRELLRALRRVGGAGRRARGGAVNVGGPMCAPQHVRAEATSQPLTSVSALRLWACPHWCSTLPAGAAGVAGAPPARGPGPFR